MSDLRKVYDTIGEEWKYKWYNRVTFIRDKHDEVVSFLPEYKAGGKKCLDFSCGNGIMLEILRYYGNEIMGTEVPTCSLFQLLNAQGVPYNGTIATSSPILLKTNPLTSFHV
jgi:hypothetical protein